MGADYDNITRKSVLGSSCEQLATNLQRFAAIQGGSQLFGAEIDARQAMPFPGILTNLYVRIDVAPGAGEDIDFRVFINGGASALVLNLAGAAQVDDGPDVSLEPIAAGDTVTMRIVSSLNAVAVFPTWSIELREI